MSHGHEVINPKEYPKKFLLNRFIIHKILFNQNNFVVITKKEIDFKQYGSYNKKGNIMLLSKENIIPEKSKTTKVKRPKNKTTM